MKINRVVITHNDLDGHGSAAMLALPTDELYMLGTRDIDLFLTYYLKTITEPTEIVVADLHVAEDLVTDLLKSKFIHHVTILDHHQTCPDYKPDNKLTLVKKINDGKNIYSGTKIALQYAHDSNRMNRLVHSIYNTPHSNLLVDAINNYDNGIFSDWNVPVKDIKLDIGLNTFIYDKYDELCDDYNMTIQLEREMSMTRFNKFSGTEDYNKLEKMLVASIVHRMINLELNYIMYKFLDPEIEFTSEDMALLCKHSHEQRLEDYKGFISTLTDITLQDAEHIRCLYTDIIYPQFSIFAQRYMRDNKNIDAIMSKTEKNYTIRVSPYCDWNSGLYMQQYGGGGHPKASGCPIAQLNWMNNR